MLRIDCKSPDRVAILVALDDLHAGQVDQQQIPPDCMIWCIGVDEATLTATLQKICRHPFKLSIDDGSPSGIGGGNMTSV